MVGEAAKFEFSWVYLQRSNFFTLNFWIQVEQAQAGLESLSSAQKTITRLRENFVEIDKYEDY